MYSLEYSHLGDSFVTLNIPLLENWNDIPKLLPFASRPGAMIYERKCALWTRTPPKSLGTARASSSVRAC